MTRQDRKIAVTVALLLVGAVGACSRHPAGHREPAAVEYASLAKDGRALTVIIDVMPDEGCSEDRQTESVERSDSVTLSASARVTAPACDASAIMVPTHVRLRSPLGGRRLIDGVTGRTVTVR